MTTTRFNIYNKEIAMGGGPAPPPRYTDGILSMVKADQECLTAQVIRTGWNNGVRQ